MTDNGTTSETYTQSTKDNLGTSPNDSSNSQQKSAKQMAGSFFKGVKEAL